jgi:Heterokaryon incompatibility protein (HET)
MLPRKHSALHEMVELPVHSAPDPSTDSVSGSPTGARLYSPLRDAVDAIRLMRLVRTGSEADHNEIIRCEMQEVLLRDKPQYLALSYTWGPPHRIAQLERMTSARNSLILCNGKRMQVAANLNAFLKRLVQKDQFDEWLWADAVCINQEDSSERTCQVQKMDRIFKGARGVIAWLGEDTNYTSRGFRGIQKLAQGGAMDSLTLEEWLGISVISQSFYFWRSWIVQEIVLAAHITVMSGDNIINWEELSFAADCFRLRPVGTRLRDMNDTIDALNAYRKRYRKAGYMDLLELLDNTRKCFASDDRDKVYAMLGLCRKDTRELPSLQPIYRGREANALYIETTQEILKDPEGLRILSLVESYRDGKVEPYSDGFKAQQLSAPAWVPNWSDRTARGLKKSMYDMFEASGNVPRYVEITKDGRKLVLKGMFLDQFGQSSMYYDQYYDGSYFSRELPDVYHNGQSKFEAFWRTAILDTAGDPVQSPAHAQFEDGFRWWVEKEGGDKWKRAFPELEDGIQSVDATIRKQFQRAYEKQETWGIFQTRKGYLGKAPKSCMSKETCVWLIAGCRIPICLRRAVDEAWNLIGPAYLHGFMRGEALQGRGEKSFKRICIV